MSRIERAAIFARRCIGERLQDAESEFRKHFAGPLIGGSFGFVDLEFNFLARRAIFRIATTPPIESGDGTMEIG